MPAAPLHVLERVRSDYQRRLDGVTEQLRAHADTLDQRLMSDRAERDGLLTRAVASRDALAEAELRHLVGEYDGVRYETERRRHVGDLETFELSLGAVNERIERLEDVHALVTSPPSPVVDEPEPVVEETPSIEMLAPDPEPEMAEVEPPVVDDDLIDIEIVDQIEDVAEAAVAEEEAALDSLFDEVEVLPQSEVRPFEPEVVSAPTFAPLSFTPTAAPVDRNPPAGPAFGQRPTQASPRRQPEIEPPAPPRQVVEEAVAVPAPAVEPAPVVAVETADEVPTARAEERTLRCGECGAMNLALEWYCEKCGAELSTV